jgi:toxin ParE1/3/4
MGRRRYRVFWARAASQDLVDLVTFIAADSPINARRVLQRLREKASTLDVAPEHGRIVPELGKFGIRAFRELIVKPYRLVYRLAEGRVSVVAVFDGRRDLEDVLLERLVRDRP